MTDNVHAVRETWLMAAANGLRPMFERIGQPLIVPVRLSMGFPSTGALSSKRRRLGECWHIDASSDGHVEIMVSPLMDDNLEILGTVAHELGHAVLGPSVGHKKPFANLMAAIGLDGPAVSTYPGPKFKTETARLLEELGPFPHGRMVPLIKERKEKVVIYRCVCPRCGYTARVIRRWLEESGPPLCPVDKIPLQE